LQEPVLVTTSKIAQNAELATNPNTDVGNPANLPNSIGVGKSFCENMWYFAAAGNKLKRGDLVSKTMLGKLVAVGRRNDGEVFAIEDICPHQAVQLSAGRFDGNEVECTFHGWRFDTKGVCTAIPSLVESQCMNLCGIKTKTYPCREVQGNVWVYFGDKSEDELPDVPRTYGVEDVNKFDRTTTTLILPNHIDYNAVALIDTAHVPFVHNSWWWRNAKKLTPKEKHYLPDQTGWTIAKHHPSKHSLLYSVISDKIDDEIGFRLPACRIERIIYKGRTVLAGITALTPIDEKTTELNHTTYWIKTIPGIAPLVTPFVQYFVRTFLSQDKDMAEMQEKCLAQNPKLIMTIRDAGTPGRWYFELKRAWNEAYRTGEPFETPVKDSFLKWRT
jgi:phenylpropionate dioxygenase-like ring-hydroxylating dioxygenase large terminal subunit